MTRRSTLAAAGTAVAGFLGGRLTGHDETEQTDTRDSDHAEITALDVSPNATTVEDYSYFELVAEYEAGTEADWYMLPTIYVVDVEAETVLPQVPMKEYDPGEMGTYETSFLAPENVEERTTVLVHMDSEVASFGLE